MAVPKTTDRAQPKARRSRNPADLVVRARLRESVSFPDLSERLALKLSAVPHYTSRAHFWTWHRRLGGPDFHQLTGIFTPLYAVGIEVTDVPLDRFERLDVRGETYLAKVVDESGAVTHLVREGHHTVSFEGTTIARANFVNVFTRYDPDPARRRVTELPAQMGLGLQPARVTTLPKLEDLLPVGTPTTFRDVQPRVWHYGQTDPNRHVTAMVYLREIEAFAADELWRADHDLRRLYAAKARIIFRKPCFRGEGYRRVAWLKSESPVVVAGAVCKADEPAEARPAVAVELTFASH